jgi:Ca-activated chloride channel family protein
VTGLTFDDLRWLHLLWAVLAAGAVGLYGIWRRRVALRRFAAASLLPRLAPGIGWTRPTVRLALILASLVALVAALIGPRWGEQTQVLLRRNIDVLVLLDVSRSMLARDIAPNRLERAKLAIRDDLLPALGGDRIGLITFAGVPSLACPLTSDYGFFRLALDDVTTRSAPRGGTLIGDAIRKAGDLFRHGLDTHKVVVLITDGEDQQSYPVEAAAALAQEEQASIIALALGDPEQGARIPVPAERGEKYLEYEGQPVRSRADFAVLEQVARASPQGVFVPAGTSNFDLGDIYREVASAIRAEQEPQQRRVQQPARYHPFAVAALLLVLLDSALRDGPRQAAGAWHADGKRRHGTRARGPVEEAA